MMAPTRVVKEKHVKLKLASASFGAEEAENSPNEIARLATPRCHPDAAAFRRRAEDGRNSVVYNAIGWRMAERWQTETVVPGDMLDIAFTLELNPHPDFGGLELSLRDFKSPTGTTEAAAMTEEQPQPA